MKAQVESGDEMIHRAASCNHHRIDGVANRSQGGGLLRRLPMAVRFSLRSVNFRSIVAHIAVVSGSCIPYKSFGPAWNPFSPRFRGLFPLTLAANCYHSVSNVIDDDYDSLLYQSRSSKQMFRTISH